MTPPEFQFDEFQSDLAALGPEAALERLAGRFREVGDFHGLFDTRLMQARRRLGLPIILTTPLEDLAEPLRGQVEAAYLEACRETGWLLWNAGKFREAWMYLRPLGENAMVAEALDRIEPSEENLSSLIEIALHEGVAPAHGYELILRNYGTCNAITAFDAEMGRFNRSQQQAAAALLIRQVHAELLANVRADIVRHEGQSPPVVVQASRLQGAAETAAPQGTAAEHGLPQLLEGREWLFADNGYHIDTSHLSAAVRIARIVEDPAELEMAGELTEYGRRLSATFQSPGDAPFEETYPSHGLFFVGQLGRQVDEAIRHFRDKADKASVDEEGTGAAEVYVVLLMRIGRLREALEEHIRLMPAGVRTTGFAPTVLELARLAGGYERLLTVCRERGDLLGFAAGLLSKADAST
jgi:hypothetical protein